MAAPAEVLDTLSKSAEYKKASRKEYAHLKAWLDKLHPKWQITCGLEPTVDGETGAVEWLPAQSAKGPGASQPAPAEGRGLAAGPCRGQRG